MCRDGPRRLFFAAALQGLFIGNIGQLVKPIGAQIVKVRRPDFTVIGQHVNLGDPVAELPADPVGKPRRFRRAGDASRLGDGIKSRRLLLLGKLIDMGLEGVIDIVEATHTDTGNPGISVPLVLGQKTEEKIRDPGVLHIKEMPAADVEGGAIHLRAAAQTTRFLLRLDDDKRRFSRIQKHMRESQPAGSGAEDHMVEINDFRHG